MSQDPELTDTPPDARTGDPEVTSHLTEETLQSIALFPEENPYPVLRVDSDGILLYANRSAADLLDQWENTIGGRVPDYVVADVQAALANGENRELALRCGERDLSFALVPIIARRYVNFYGRDITRQKRTLDALRESEQRYRNLFHFNHAVMLLIDPQNGNIIDANAAACRYYGYTWEELTARQIKDINTLTPENLQEEMRKAAVAENQHFFFQHQLADGRIRDVEVFTGPLTVKGRELLYSIIHDITERKQIEDALRESEQRFASFMLHLPAAAWLKDLEGRYLYANAETERILSMPFASLRGKLYEEVLSPETARKFRESDARILTDGSRIQFTESFRDAGGDEHRFIISKFVIPGSDGRPAFIAGVAIDITDRFRAEQEIVRLNADLKARAEDLENLNRELEAFNYTVAHDLRKPLTLINGYCQILQEMCGERIDEQGAHYLRRIYNSTLNMSQLIDALLNFSRLTHVELRLETVDLSELARHLVSELEQAESEREVSNHIAQGIRVKGDPELLRLVMSNLLGNAWKYSAGHDEAVIEFGTCVIDGQAVCFIRDNGIGFNQADAEKLFLPFQRLPGAGKITGFGIGLATVARIIQRHGGRIWAEGAPGEGATFYFTCG